MSVVDLFVSGFLKAGEGLHSSLGRVWKDSSHNFAANATVLFAYGNGVVVGINHNSGNAGNAEIARSTDGGRTFSADLSHNHGDVIAAIAYGGGVFIAAGSDGDLSRSTDFGATWGALVSNDFATNGDSIAGLAYGNGVWIAVGTSSTSILRSTDSGVTWAAPTTVPSDNIAAVCYAGGSTFIAISSSDAAVYRSTDNGENWSSAVEITSASRLGMDIGYGNHVLIATLRQLAPGYYYVFRSEDLGLTWSEVTWTSSDFARKVGYAEGIFFVGKYNSTDGGRSWTDSSFYGATIGGTVNTYGVVYDEEHQTLVVGNTGGVDLGLVIYSQYLEAGAGIVEQGTNSNGSYVIFSSGLQVCWNQDTVTDQAIDNAYGSLYQDTRQVTFPKAFGSSPVILPGYGKWGTGASWATAVSHATTTTATLRFMDTSSRATGTSFYYGWAAIGWAA